MNKVIGRNTETTILNAALQSEHSELVVVYGRRRIGKTFLVNQTYKSQIKFELTGIHNLSLQDQLENFYLKLSLKYKKAKVPTSWIRAFHELSLYVDKIKTRKKKVIFIDEFPWLDTRKSKFLPAFENFWNSFAAKRSDLVIVICGSAASYMVNKIIKSRGGLHNRLTRRIHLKPFTLRETEKLLRYKKINLTRYDILQVYMALGGIPHYLEKINIGESVAQLIDRLLFSKDAFLRMEFDNVFASLFDQYENHEEIVRLLASVRMGLTRNKILDKTSLSSGGRLTRTLNELEESGFIENYTPYLGTKNSLYRLSDEYAFFYLKFVEKSKPSKLGTWTKMQGQQSYKSWAGFSFETICIKHIDQIISALNISGIRTVHGSWIGKGIGKGSQIDLLIDRDDQVINLCEMKFYKGPFSLDKKYAEAMATKAQNFVAATKTKKTIFTTFITTYGVKPNKYSLQYIHNQLSIDDLFSNI